MKELEEKVLKSFIKCEGKEVESLDLIVCIADDEFPDDEGIYQAQVMERQDNGRVWNCICTRTGNVKETYEL